MAIEQRMDRIGRALQKSRLQRGLTPNDRIRVFDRPGEQRGGPVEYTKTKVVPVSRAALRRNRIVSWQLNSKIADVYRLLRAQVLRRMAKLGVTTLGITSAIDGEGKTFTAANLALVMALDVNQTVLLVDADLRAPAIAQGFGIAPEAGLDDYLAGRASLSECLINPGLERLVILPARAPIETSAELLTSPAMVDLAGELKSRYADRIIIYDLPPLLTAGDTVGFLPNVEATLLVVREGAISTAEARRAADLLSEHHLLGTVLNGAV